MQQQIVMLSPEAQRTIDFSKERSRFRGPLPSHPLGGLDRWSFRSVSFAGAQMFFASTQIRDRPPEDGSIPSLAHTCTGLWTVSSFLVVYVSPTIKVAASVCSIARAECCLLLVFMLLVGEVEVDVRLEVVVGEVVVGIGFVVGRYSG